MREICNEAIKSLKTLFLVSLTLYLIFFASFEQLQLWSSLPARIEAVKQWNKFENTIAEWNDDFEYSEGHEILKQIMEADKSDVIKGYDITIVQESVSPMDSGSETYDFVEFGFSLHPEIVVGDIETGGRLYSVSADFLAHFPVKSCYIAVTAYNGLRATIIPGSWNSIPMIIREDSHRTRGFVHLHLNKLNLPKYSTAPEMNSIRKSLGVASTESIDKSLNELLKTKIKLMGAELVVRHYVLALFILLSLLGLSLIGPCLRLLFAGFAPHSLPWILTIPLSSFAVGRLINIVLFILTLGWAIIPFVAIFQLLKLDGLMAETIRPQLPILWVCCLIAVSTKLVTSVVLYYVRLKNSIQPNSD